MRHSRQNGDKWRSYPGDIIPAWIADMDYSTAEPIRRALQEAVMRSDLGYPFGARKDGLPELTADRMQTRFGWQIDPSRMEFLTDVMQGITIAISQFSKP